MVDKGKLSKIKNIYGESQKLYFEDVRPIDTTGDGQTLDINTHFIAVSWNVSGGGSVLIQDASNPIRIPTGAKMIKGHTAPICDVKFSPFKTNFLATGSEDATIKIWDIPQEGLLDDLTVETQSLGGHLKKLQVINWNPTVFEIIASGGFDNKVNIWNISSQEAIDSYNFNEPLMSLEWNDLGSLLGLTSKDKMCHIIDPKSHNSELNFKNHESSKNSKMKWVSDSQLITVGYSKRNEREIKLWDIKNTSKEIQTLTIDSQSGPITPYYDIDSGLILCPGRGEGNIKYYEYSSGALRFLGEYKSGTSQKSVCMFPKRTMNYNRGEIARIGKLTATTLEYVSFYVPKRVEGFHAELYPDCVSGEPSTTVEEWKSGVYNPHVRKPINTLENKFLTAEKVNFEKKECESPTRNRDTSGLVSELESLKIKNSELEENVRSLISEIENLKIENEKLKGN